MLTLMNILIVVLLLVISACEILRVYTAYRPQSKKRQFEEKIKQVQATIWDLQFKLHKTAEIREDVRKEYDQAQAQLHSLKERKDESKEAKAQTQKEIEFYEGAANRFKAQLENLDIEMHGLTATPENPEGYTGIQQQIESYEELKAMLSNYVRRL